MDEFLEFLIINPATWVAALVLVGLCAAALALRSRYDRRVAGMALVGAWLILTLLGQLTDLDHFFDGRFWISAAVTVAVSIAPVMLFVLIIPASRSRFLTIGGGLAAAIVGALLFPLIALLSVCALGIDCL